MKMVIALFGLSCVGKSTVAKKISILLPASIRSCGEVVKSQARTLGILPEDLPFSIHKQIDEETKWLAQNFDGYLVVEGRYLDNVFSAVEHVLLFELVCPEAVRLSRHAVRTQLHGRTDSLDQVDQDTTNFRQAFYGGTKISRDRIMSIDTGSKTPDVLASEIFHHAKNGKDAIESATSVPRHDC